MPSELPPPTGTGARSKGNPPLVLNLIIYAANLNQMLFFLQLYS